MNDYIKCMFDAAASLISINAPQEESREEGNHWISLVALGVISGLGVLYYFNQRREAENPRREVENPMIRGINWNLGDRGIILPPDLEAIRNGEHAADIAWAIGKLNPRGLVTQENLEAILIGGGANAWMIALAIENLSKAGILTPENRERILVESGKYAWALSEIITDLNANLLMTPENWDSIMVGMRCEEEDRKAVNVHSISLGIERLFFAGILTPENRNAILTKEGRYARSISDMLACLNRSNILTPENRNKILGEGTAFLLHNRMINNLVFRIEQPQFDQWIYDIDKSRALDLTRVLGEWNGKLPSNNEKLLPEVDDLRLPPEVVAGTAILGIVDSNRENELFWECQSLADKVEKECLLRFTSS